MSSPPTSTTSTRAGHLHSVDHKHQQRSTSFPSALNPFRKKAPPEPAKAPSPVEPYEVAPGIWNTDATAKVFGYLDNEPNKDKPNHPTPHRKPVPLDSSRHPSKEIPVEVTIREPALVSPNRHVDLPQQPIEGTRNEVNRRAEGTQKPAGIRRMRTVSRDDRLVQRGANPRTGLVSPFITSDSSDDNIFRDYLSLGKPLLDRPLPKGRTRSGKWKQDRAGWSLVESPLLTPIAQSTSDRMSRKVSLKKLEDKLLVEMPGVDNPEPDNMTDRQIKRYQESMARAFNKEGSHAMVNPDSLPSPRPPTPEGPSTPPNRLQRIRRKMVGSGPGRKEDSDGTIVMSAQNRSFSAPQTRKGSKESQKVRIVAPSNTPRGSSMVNHGDKIATNAENPFLGLPTKPLSDQVKGATYSPPLHRQHIQSSIPLEPPQSPTKAEFVEPPASLTLKQYLPRLHLLHPSHFANLESPSYRRPTELLPARLRPVQEQRKTIEDACTITTTSMLSQKQETSQRPKVQRQNVITGVPRAKQSSQKREGSKENYLQEDILKKKSSSYMNTPVGTSDSRTPRQDPIHTQEESIPVPGRAGIQHQIRVPSRSAPHGNTVLNQGAGQWARSRIPEDYHYQQMKETQPSGRSGAIPMTRGLRVGSANIVRDPGQGKPGLGVGITHMYGLQGGDDETERGVATVEEDSADLGQNNNKQPRTATDIGLNCDSSVWFAGQWADAGQDQGVLVNTISKQGPMVRKRSISRKAADIQTWVSALPIKKRTLDKLDVVGQSVYRMACHVTQTLHPGSPALTLLRSPNEKIPDYLHATKEVVLACVYLLLLLNLMMALRKILMFLGLVVYWAWHPLRTAIGVFKWCMLG